MTEQQKSRHIPITPEQMYQTLVLAARPDLHIRTWKIWDCLYEFLFWAKQEGKLLEAQTWMARMLEPTDWPVRRETFWQVLTPDRWKTEEEVSPANLFKVTE